MKFQSFYVVVFCWKYILLLESGLLFSGFLLFSFFPVQMLPASNPANFAYCHYMSYLKHFIIIYLSFCIVFCCGFLVHILSLLHLYMNHHLLYISLIYIARSHIPYILLFWSPFPQKTQSPNKST